MKKSELYRIMIGVRPTAEHPQFGKLYDAVLILYLFAASVQDTKRRSRAILEQLPYKWINCGQIVTPNIDRANFTEPLMQKAHAIALESANSAGIGFYCLYNYDPGKDGWLNEFFDSQMAQR